MIPCTVVAVDLGGTKIAGALVRYEAEGQAPVIVERCSTPTEAARGGDAVLQSVIDVVKKMIAASDVQPVGVGIAAAGCIDPKDGSVLYANEIMPGWWGQPLAAAVRKATGLPVAALGDVHGHALGETRWGGAQGLSSCLFVAAGTGMGGAFVINGKVIRGAHGAAGHIGHTLHPLRADFPCTCGAEAHVEGVTSGTGIGALYQGVSMADPSFDPSLNGLEVSRRAEAGEEKAIQTLKDAGFALGQACGSWANMLDPEAIIITGTVVNAGPIWHAALEEGFASQALVPLREIPVIGAKLGGDAPLIGAVEHLMDTIAAQ